MLVITSNKHSLTSKILFLPMKSYSLRFSPYIFHLLLTVKFIILRNVRAWRGKKSEQKQTHNNKYNINAGIQLSCQNSSSHLNYFSKNKVPFLKKLLLPGTYLLPVFGLVRQLCWYMKHEFPKCERQTAFKTLSQKQKSKEI